VTRVQILRMRKVSDPVVQGGSGATRLESGGNVSSCGEGESWRSNKGLWGWGQGHLHVGPRTLKAAVTLTEK
jgi:hypothetical protein